MYEFRAAGVAHAATVRMVRREKPSLDSLGFHHRLFITSTGLGSLETRFEAHL